MPPPTQDHLLASRLGAMPPASAVREPSLIGHRQAANNEQQQQHDDKMNASEPNSRAASQTSSSSGGGGGRSRCCQPTHPTSDLPTLPTSTRRRRRRQRAPPDQQPQQQQTQKHQHRRRLLATIGHMSLLLLTLIALIAASISSSSANVANFEPASEPANWFKQQDAFGSRLANNRHNNDEELDESPSSLAEPLNQADNNAFSNRQGSLLQPEANELTPPRRQVRQPAPQQLNRQQQPRPQRPVQDQQQQQQQLARQQQQQQQQERFQRLRTPPSGQLLPQASNFEQFPRAQQAQPQAQQQQQPRAQLQLNANGLPTLSAFDLSSLANLASNQPPQSQPQIQFVTSAPQTANGQQLGSLNFRRQINSQPAQPNGNRNQAPPASFFNEPARGQPPVPNSQSQQQPQPKPTELPFIRQVFRPSSSLGESGADSDEPLSQSQPRPSSGGRPTPPPLFVPARQQQTLAGARPPRPLETGFAPIQPTNPRPDSMFFEPTGQRQRQQVPQVQPSRAVANQQTVRLPSLPPPTADSINEAPVSANQIEQQQPTQQQQQQQQQQRKPPVRRPSQRPHVPLVVQSNQQLPAVTTTTQSSRPPAAQDVIRVAANAIQAAQEGLAAFNSATTGASILQEVPQSTTQASLTSSSTVGVGTNTQDQTPAITTTASSAPTITTTTTTEANTGRRALSSQRTPSSLASNFFQTLTSAATLAPSSFSPALPINQAVAASGGRRRIPVRSQQQQQQQRAQTTTLPSVSTPTAGAAPGSSTGSGPVRRPEIEEFYETIGASQGFSLSGSPSSTTQIDGFGAPARPKPPARLPETTTSTPQGEAERLPTTTTDLYGSRLQTNQQQSSGAQQEQRDTAASNVATGQLQQLQRLRPEPNSVSEPTALSSAGSPAPAPTQATGDKQQAPVMVPVTYVTTLTYLTTVLHGTHTLETSHESVERSTQMATLNAQLMDQIEHKLALIEPTATVSLSSRTKGRGTTLVNLKSAVSAFNQELVEALGAANGVTGAQLQATSSVGAAIAPTATLDSPQASVQQLLPVSKKQQAQKPLIRASRTVSLEELASASKQLMTEYVYLYTMRPVEQPDQTLALSTRSEMVNGPTMSEAELASRLQEAQQQLGERLIDSNGLLRMQPDVDFGAINLGSTVGKETPQMLTEVNVNLNTFVKFDGVSNVMLEVRPTRLADNSQTAGDTSGPLQARGQRPSQRPAAPLDTSFNLQLTLGNALDQLERPRQTPALGDQATALNNQQQPQQPTASRTDELLRSSALDSAAPATPASSSQLSRSQLRSRVSSRIRNSSLQTLQPARAVSPTLAAAPIESSASVAASIGGLRQRPNKSRLVRPQLSRQSAGASDPSALDTPAAPINPTAQAAQPVAASSTLATRSTKPRFVVVTKTGQFGVRASAKSSLAAAAAAASAAAGSTSGSVEPSQVQPTLQTLRVSSRFSKIRGRFGPTQSRSPTSSELLPTSVLAPSTSTSAAPTAEQSPADTSATQSTSTTSRPQEQQGAAEAVASPPAIKLDGSQSVVVTYFTTTTHTIPFELNSETVFTTIEETNSRIATEFMSDLSSHFIDPSPTASLPAILQTAAPTLPGITGGASSESQASSEQAQTTTPTSSEQPTSVGTTASGTQPPTSSGAADANVAKPTPPIEPSFVVALNTRTFFTTFTYFTTYSAGSDSQTVKSSESTTSNIITETISSPVTLAPSVAATLAPSLESVQAAQQPSESQTAQPVDESLVTKTLLSTMTYYGTVYNGTQTSLTPIVDVSTQLLTLGAGPSAQFNVNSDALASSSSVSPTPPIESTSAPSVSEISSQQPPVSSSSVDLSDKIARTRSMYTTLTHFITFYSGTKTQLSTIQEISPTVVTEYVDRTLFEQQADSAGSNSVQLVVPTIAPSVALDGAQVLNTQLPTTTSSSTSSTTSSSSSSSTEESSSSSSGEQTSPPAATTTTTSTPSAGISAESSSSTSPSGELGSVSVSQPERPASDSQAAGNQEPPRVLASSDKSAGGEQPPVVESKESAGDESNKHTTNIIELSDLIASNSSQSGRVALAGNLGAAIKDIVQLLAGNKTQSGPGGSLIDSLPSTTTTIQSGSSSEQPSSDAPATTTTTTTTTAAATTTTTTGTTQTSPSTRARPPTRLFGNKQREQQQQQQQQLQGSISSPSATTIFDDSPQQQQQSTRATPDLSTVSGRQREPQPAATIFFGDEAGDERSKKIKTVWPGAQSTQFVTSIEPSTRSLIVTTTKVYYTRDAPITITSSFTSVIAPRTFVSTIVGTRTQVNQLSGPTASASLAQTPQAPPTTTPSTTNGKAASASTQQRQVDRAADVQNKAVVNKYKEQKQQQQQQDQLARKQQREQLIARQQQEQRVAAARAKEQQLLQQAAANINQCQPACKASANEICKFTPSSDLGVAGSFACACRPGYFMALNSVGQRACQEVQSYVIMLRLLQVGNEQVAFKRELQQRNSADFKQYARIVREHVKRAYMTSDLVRDRFVGSEVLSFGRTLSVSSGTSSQSMGAQPASGKQPVALNASQLDPLNAGVIVNMTIHLQSPTAAQAAVNELQVDEAMLKEELTKKLNMRQAAALAAAAAAGQQAPAVVPASSSSSESPAANGPTNQTEAATQTANQTQVGLDEMLPNPNALFLADVEQVQDLDECASPLLNDCHEGAVCLNEPGSYKCDCREYPDLNPLNPGRQCANELKSCDFCNNRGDCLRVPSLLPPVQASSSNSSSSSSSAGSSQPTAGNGRGQSFSTVCQCHRIYLGRRCEINGLLLATLLPIAAILLIISVCLVIYCCRRWRKRSSMSKGFRNIGAFGPGLIGGTLDRKAMLESSSESSDTHQRARNAALGVGTYESHAHLHHHPHHHHLGVAPTGVSEAGSSSQESSPRGPMMSGRQAGGVSTAADGSVMPSGAGSGSYLHHLSPSAAAAAAAGQSGGSLNPYCGSIPQPIQIPRARHNQVNYAVHRGQVYMW